MLAASAMFTALIPFWGRFAADERDPTTPTEGRARAAKESTETMSKFPQASGAALTTLPALGIVATTAAHKTTTSTKALVTERTHPTVEAATEWEASSFSVRGRPIETKIVGHGPRSVLWIGGIHGDERQGSAISNNLEQAIVDAHLENLVTVFLIRDLNPDGSIARNRCNANGVDLNRNLPHEHEADAPAAGGCTTGRTTLSEPESKFLSDTILGFRPDLILVAHGRSASYPNSQLVDGDGPAEEDRRIFQNSSGWFESVPPNYDTKSGTLGRWAGDDLGIPVLTLEFPFGRSPDEAWETTRDALIDVIAGPRI